MSLATIENVLHTFANDAFYPCAKAFWQTLGYSSSREMPETAHPTAFIELYDQQQRFNQQHGLFKEWQAAHLLFQLTVDDFQAALNFSGGQVDQTIIESYLFIALELKAGPYSRSQLATITRAVNKIFDMPAMILFKHGDTLTLSAIHRRIGKSDASKDVLEKVSLIKDIRIKNPHRAHLDILNDLSFVELNKKHKIKHFVGLHHAWLNTLSISVLNKKFYQEIANWYFGASQHVVFPQYPGKTQDETQSVAMIRMITRLVFIWFVKEKGLIPENLFDKNYLDGILNFKDKTGSTYYKAILQNLFFATLNTEMDKRAFSPETQYHGKSQGYLQHGFYRYARFFKQPDMALKLFEAVPFLNGGLFECLDDEKMRLDCFSNNPKNEDLLKVPDALFFGAEMDVDLNAIYATKNKTYKTRGLIEILNAYKFTIAENTPLEEEIALDPELLGKIFENLLAAYNPETGVTARKQTGSFYTPREIVDYMVDESLLAYFDSVLNPKKTLQVLKTCKVCCAGYCLILKPAIHAMLR